MDKPTETDEQAAVAAPDVRSLIPAQPAAVAVAQSQAEYDATRTRHTAEMRARIPELVIGTTGPAEPVRERQLQGLRALLAAAVEGSPWHRERLAGVDPETFTVADLASLPVMTKDDVIDHFDGIVTDRRVTTSAVEIHLARLTRDAYLYETYHAAVSSGSSGRRSLFVYDWDAWSLWYLSLFRYIYRDPRSLPPDGRLPLVVAVGAAHPAHGSAAIRQTFSPDRPAIGISILNPLPQVVAELNGHQPDMVYTFASYLRGLAAEQIAGRLQIQPRVIMSTAEPLLPDTRELVTRAWPDVVLHNWYATTETGAIAASCGYGEGMHLNEDLVILEAVDAEGRPVPVGERSAKVYVTNLANRLMPLIRYEISDQVSLLPEDEACPCGSPHRRIADVEGRHEDSFWYAGGSLVHFMTFFVPLSRDTGIIEFQVHQTEDGADVHVLGEPTNPDHERELTASLAALGLVDPVVRVVKVDSLERNQNVGKLKRFVPLSR